MKTWLVFVALISAYGMATASEWKAITSSENNFVLVDVLSVKTQGKLQKAWFISNLETAEVVPGTTATMYLSSKYLAYFSCTENTISTAAVYFYPEQNARGQAVASSSAPGDAIDVAPDSVNEAMLKFVCTKRKRRADK